MIKKELPSDIKGLANQTDFSATNLFGDDLYVNIKEVGELNKSATIFLELTPEALGGNQSQDALAGTGLGVFLIREEVSVVKTLERSR